MEGFSVASPSDSRCDLSSGVVLAIATSPAGNLLHRQCCESGNFGASELLKVMEYDSPDVSREREDKTG